ncbi:MAG: SO_0444 family Cu/Zn efflux transporter [Planctomycetota bacterium]
MELLTNYLAAVFSMIAESAPFLLFGFFLAGLLRVLIPQKKVTRYLGGDSVKSVTLASIVGIPLPLCSCSVLPTATELRKSGAGKGATTAFLISTPETGVDSIGITWALLDPLFTLVRPLSALITALLTGSLVNHFVTSGWDSDEPAGDSTDGECADESCCAAVEPPNGRRTPREAVREAARYAFGPLLDDLTPWFTLGFLLSGLLALAIPDGFFSENIPSGLLAGLIMAVVATPMYVCAAAATPLAAVLIAKGLDPGAALVFLLVGPATNAATMLVVLRLLGKRVLAIYLVGIVGCALVLGAIVSSLYAGSGMDLPAAASGLIENGLSPVGIVLGTVLVVLLLRSAIRTGLFGRFGERVRRLTGFDPASGFGRVVLVAAIIVVWLTSAFSIVGPGGTGWVVRFGRVVRPVPESGLVFHWPAPIESVTVLPKDRVRSVEIGHVRGEIAPPRDLAEQGEAMTGEENLLRLAYTVQFDVKDPWLYRYRVADPEGVVAAFAEAALREALADRLTGWILVGHRAELQEEIGARLQASLDSIESGVRVRLFSLEDVHAAPEVHSAYRDVASALEDRATSVRDAEGDYTEALAQARGLAFRLAEEAEGDYATRVEAARGEAEAFTARREAFRESPAVTGLRMVLDAAETTLAKVRGIFLLGGDVDVELWRLGRRREAREVPKIGLGSRESKEGDSE